MARKFEICVKNWLPFIIKSSLEYDMLNTLGILKSSGRIQVGLTPLEQLNEIKSVLDNLVESRLLFEGKSLPEHYFGIDFASTTYSVSDDFKKFIEQININPQDSTVTNAQKLEIIINQKVYNLNLTLAFEKLIEVKAGLINL